MLKNWMIALLLGIIFWIFFFISSQYDLIKKSQIENENIAKKIALIEENKKQKYIDLIKLEYEKKDLLDTSINVKTNTKSNTENDEITNTWHYDNLSDEIDDNFKNNKQKQVSYSFKIYNFSPLYEKIYKYLTNKEEVKKHIWEKAFENSKENKFLNELKKTVIITVIEDKNTNKILNILSNIPININCIENHLDFCPKKIDNSLNDIYENRENNNSDLIFIKTWNIVLSEEQMDTFINNNSNFEKLLKEKFKFNI